MVIGGMAMPLAVSGGFAVVGHGRETKSTVKSTVFLGCPVWFVNWTENLFWPPQHRLPILFKILVSFVLIFYVQYGLFVWFIGYSIAPKA